jgi:hypothetical protein
VASPRRRPTAAESLAAARATATANRHALDLALSRAARAPECEVGLTRNAKGDVQIALTVKGDDLETVTASAQAAFDGLCTQYPYGAPAPTGDGEAAS